MTGSTMTLSDIAHLCGVSRPLVTMWRRRTSVGGREIPFPAPVATIAGSEHFDAGQVREYLRETGRGNNPDAALEALALAPPADAPFEDLVVLLSLRHLADDDISDRDLAELAAEADPRDLYVASEVAQVGHQHAGYIDELRAVSFGPDDALARLEATRTGRSERLDVLTAAGVALIARLVDALIVHLGPDQADLVDGSTGRSPVGTQLARELGRPLWIGEDALARPARRRALLAGVDQNERGDGSALRVDCVVGLNDEEAFDRADLLEVELGLLDVGVLIGPSRLLVDRLADGTPRDDRDQQIQGGQVRAVLRLPRGLSRAASQQSLAVWVLGGTRAPERSLLVADLSDQQAADIDADDLANDLVATLNGRAAHHFRYLVPRSVPEVIAGRTVVPRGYVGRPVSGVGNSAGRFLELARSVSAPVPALSVREGESRTDRVARTIAQLRTSGDLTVRSGSRLDLAWATPGGSVATIGLDGWRDVRFDPLDLEERAPSARRTEPGDVVVTTTPPRAEVDTVGGRVVPTPARILRLGPKATIGPHTLAAQINRLPPSARDLDAWQIRLGSGSSLERRLAAAEALRADLLARATALEDLTHLLLDGDSGLAFDIDPSPDRIP